MNNTTWIIKDGKNTRFWRDKWISNVGTLEDLFPSTCPAAELNFPVSFYASALGWNWNHLENLVPQDICDKIANVKAPSPKHP